MIEEARMQPQPAPIAPGGAARELGAHQRVGDLAHDRRRGAAQPQPGERGDAGIAVARAEQQVRPCASYLVREPEQCLVAPVAQFDHFDPVGDLRGQRPFAAAQHQGHPAPRRLPSRGHAQHRPLHPAALQLLGVGEDVLSGFGMGAVQHRVLRIATLKPKSPPQ